MRWLLAIPFVLVIGVFVAAGCQVQGRGPASSAVPPAPPPPAGVSFRSLGDTPNGGKSYIMTVHETGCEYLYVEMFQNGVSITPNMRRVSNESVRTTQQGCRP